MNIQPWLGLVYTIYWKKWWWLGDGCWHCFTHISGIWCNMMQRALGELFEFSDLKPPATPSRTIFHQDTSSKFSVFRAVLMMTMEARVVNGTCTAGGCPKTSQTSTKLAMENLTGAPTTIMFHLFLWAMPHHAPSCPIVLRQISWRNPQTVDICGSFCGRNPQVLGGFNGVNGLVSPSHLGRFGLFHHGIHTLKVAHPRWACRSVVDMSSSIYNMSGWVWRCLIIFGIRHVFFVHHHSSTSLMSRLMS